MSLKPLKAIAAMSLNGVIGKGNALPWNIPEELKWFKEKTLDQVILMGRKTFESIGRPLPRRESIVLSRTMPAREDLRVIKNLSELTQKPPPKDKDIWVIGGAEIYKLTLPYCSDLFLTKVKLEIEDGDAFFPEFKELFQEKEIVKATPEFTVIHYVNKNPKRLENDLLVNSEK